MSVLRDNFSIGLGGLSGCVVQGGQAAQDTTATVPDALLSALELARSHR